MQNNTSRIRVVLCRPKYGGNIGSICRAMVNMGMSDLILVGAGEFDLAEARQMACWAGPLLESARKTETLAEALADCTLVFGTTARQGLYRQHTRTPREWAGEIITAARSGIVALLFGPEDDGLSNTELEACHHLIRIPSAPVYPSINLAQAFMICAYELYVASGQFEVQPEKSPLADCAMKERMLAMWENMLLQTGFMEPDKARHMMLGVRRIFARGARTEDDVRILMGIARQTCWHNAKPERKMRRTPTSKQPAKRPPLNAPDQPRAARPPTNRPARNIRARRDSTDG